MAAYHLIGRGIPFRYDIFGSFDSRENHLEFAAVKKVMMQEKQQSRPDPIPTPWVFFMNMK